MLILSGYLRKKYAQDKPLTMSASIAFEQSYSGWTETAPPPRRSMRSSPASPGFPSSSPSRCGSVNQKGEVQAIGGVNYKIEGFFECCRKKGLTGTRA